MSLTITLTSLAAFKAAELVWPRRKSLQLRRQALNLSLWLGSLVIVGSILVAVGTVQTRPPAHIWQYAADFALLDLVSYMIHRIQHAVPWLWILHRTHHSDSQLDTSTAVRHHPLEYLTNSVMWWTIAYAFDVPLEVLGIYTATAFAFACWTHSNFRMPALLDRLLRTALITPDLHIVHHSGSSHDYGRNFGEIFSCWDRIAGTLSDQPRGTVDQIAFGLQNQP